MGLLKALFGSPKPKARPYVDEGFALTKKLITLFDLSDWAGGIPTYTQREAKAIDRELRDFQRSADAEAPLSGHKEMLFHPEIVGPMERMFGAEALHRLAGPDVGLSWELDNHCPDDWKRRVSTYLKAWAMNLDPDVLLDMARLLAIAGYKTEAKQSAAIVAAWFPSYAPRFLSGAHDPELVANITARARELMEEISKPRLLLHGLNGEDSILATWKLLFSPILQNHFGSDQSLEWTRELITKFAQGDHAGFSAQYNSRIPEVKVAMSSRPKYSMSNPPWSMVSLDMLIGVIPWVSPGFDKWFAILLQNGCALEKHFGTVLPFAFFLHGGPGDTMETAFRACAPTNAVRASAEHWLMRAYLNRREEGLHASLSDKAGRRYSMHRYIDQHGAKKEVFFDTTDSFERVEEDFSEFLHD